MLTELAIRNFAIIDALRVEFAPGLNILTGETGAGKSIIIGAVNLLLGDRASADMIRTGEDTATVEASFNLQGKDSIQALLQMWGIGNGEDLVVRRVISRSGKNRLYINGSVATLNMLSGLGEALLNVCGQHEHQVLLKEENHLDILDDYGNLLPLRMAYHAVFEELRALKEQQRRLEEQSRQKEDRQDFLRFQLAEIAEAGPHAGEDDRLREERTVLNNAQRLSELALTAHDLLYGADGAALERLKSVMDAAREIHRIDPKPVVSEEALSASYYQLEEAAFALRNYARGLVFDPVRIEAIDERLELLGRLKRKHGGNLEAVLAKKTAMEEELSRMLSLDEERKGVEEAMTVCLDQLEEKAEALTAARRAATAKLREAIEGEIHGLRMAGARFDVVLSQPAPAERGEGYLPRGRDEAVFFLSTNPGEDLKPLSRVASGGELSRIVLAMKKVLAGKGFSGTIVFDEVDSGIGGATAEIVGQKIREVAAHHQVLCITHLPQIACFADRHYRVNKQVKGDKTSTGVDLLSPEERLEEMARMLGGVDVTEATRGHAREMLQGAENNRSGRR